MPTVGQDNGQDKYSMNHFFIKTVYISGILALSVQSLYAASLHIEAPKVAPSTRAPIVVEILLDAEQDTMSGVAGNFSFPAELFDIESITSAGSIVSLWATQPIVSQEKYLDARTHITFEGIFPGGFDGVRSPYYQGKKPGILFSVILVPKQKGEGSFIVDDVVLNSFSSDAKPLPAGNVIEPVTVPVLHDVIPGAEKVAMRVKSATLSALITHDPLVEHNAWYALVHDTSERATIAKMFVAETNDYNGELVSDSAWRVAKNPYVLLYQDRSKFVNIKIIYSDNTYTTLTLPPVENSSPIFYMSRILVSVIIVLFVVYLYAQSTFAFFKKHKKQE